LPDPGADAPGYVRPPLRGSWNRLSVELVVPPSSRIPTSARLNPNVQRPSIAEIRSGKNGTGRRRFSSEGSSLFQVTRGDPGRCNPGDDKERAAGVRCRDGAATVTKIVSRSVSGFRMRF
jgi:hypothetical protein